MPTSLPSNANRIKLILSGLFLVSGSVTVLIGQLLPIFAKQYALNDLQLSFYFPAQFAGSLLGTWLTSRFARSNRFIAASFIGAILMAIGVLVMNIDSFPVSLAAFLINGIGIGLTLPAINMTVLELSPENAASSLSFLNFFWGVGAIVCKPFVDLSSRGSDIVVTTTVLAAPLLIAAAMLYFQPTRMVAADGSTNSADDISNTPIWTLPLAWAIALFNFIHVGFESGMGGWLTIYTERLDETQAVHWLSPTLLYFLFFVFGRGVAPALFRFLNENKMLFLGLFTILAGMLIAVTASSVIVLGIGAAVSGFGTSWIFPTNVSRFSHTFGASASRRATPLFIFGTLGAASSTWLIGFVSNQTGNLRSGMYVLVVSVVLLIVLQVWLGSRRTRVGEPNAT
ncbi:MAG: MFS transporter [Pyrinomonadaceae bacterium]|nr:MFS transporter [Acidobacteriota bacterium]MBP7375438.1 MFS transporter [Pyrinomonadaceae bacterium]